MPSTVLRKKLMGNVRSLVVKVGTAVLTRPGGRLDEPLIRRLAHQMAALHDRGIKLTVVSSGSIGAGMGRAGLKGRPRSLPMLQATAAIGQPALMGLYERAFAKHGLHAGQMLVTRADFEQRSRYVNVANTMAALHKLSAVPVINENDTTAVEELDRFADNDTIAALVTNLLRADLLVVLTVVDGLLDDDGVRVDLVERIDRVHSLVRGTLSPLGSGGMAAKLAAVQRVTEAGEGAVIANGRAPNVLLELLDGQRTGTFFAPAARKLSARQRWIAGAVRPAGKITVDSGAAEAVRTRGRSLLPRGITHVTGRFDRGQVVRILSPEHVTIAHGVSNYNHRELDRIKGLKSNDIARHLGHKPFDEAIHRDNLVLTLEG